MIVLQEVKKVIKGDRIRENEPPLHVDVAALNSSFITDTKSDA